MRHNSLVATSGRISTDDGARMPGYGRWCDVGAGLIREAGSGVTEEFSKAFAGPQGLCPVHDRAPVRDRGRCRPQVASWNPSSNYALDCGRKGGISPATCGVRCMPEHAKCLFKLSGSLQNSVI